MQFDLPKGVMEWTTQGTVVNSTTDSDVDPATGKTRCMSISANEVNLGIDAGVKFVTDTHKCLSLRIGEGPQYTNGNANYESLHPIVENPFQGTL